MSIPRWVLPCFVLVTASACGESAPDGLQLSRHVPRTNGGAVALTTDERVAVAANRSAGVITVFSLKPERGLENAITGSVELDLGEGSEPWAVVIGSGNDTAYAVLRKSQEVVRIERLHDNPVLSDERVAVGSEPSSIAISPSGASLLVGNWAEGTVSKIDTERFEHRATIDVNKALVETGALGRDVVARPGLAHPGALAITDDGDENDEDETLYVTEFFSQPLPNLEQEDELARLDRNRQGLVYSVAMDTGQFGPTITLSPVMETGFVDSDGAMTSCFPNQLSAATIDSERLYVTSMCASPRGPLGPVAAPTAGDPPNPANFKTLYHPAVFVVDLKANEEQPEQGNLLTRVLDAAYADDRAPANAIRMPLSPNDIAFRAGPAGGRSAYVAALGADTLSRLDYDTSGMLTGIGDPGQRYVQLSTQGSVIGVAVSQRSKPSFALALNDVTQLLSVVDLAANDVATNVQTAANTPHAVATRESPANSGRALFATGTSVWSFKGQAWSSCEGCHPGGLSDGLTWFFQRGPRRTLSAASTYEKLGEPAERRRKLLLWGANVDEVHDVEGIIRSVSGGVGAVVWQYPSSAAPSNSCRLVYDNGALPADAASPCTEAKPTSILANGLNGSVEPLVDGIGCFADDPTCDSSGTKNWNDVDAFLRSLRAPRAPRNLNEARIEQGRQLFEQGRCAACHGGPHWTLSMLFYSPGPDVNGAAPYVPERDAAGKLVLPTVLPELGKLRTSLYAVPADLAALNLAAKPSTDPACPAGHHCASFRAFSPAEDTDAARIALVYNAGEAGNDQLRCALRSVGTFPVQPTDPSLPPNVVGLVPAGAPPVFEYRQDMKTLAQGALGFNVPTLLGLSVGAPYLHGGNAPTLEQVFHEKAFAEHFRAVAPGFMNDPATRTEDVAALVEFLLSIDEATAPFTVPSDVDYDFCK